MDSLLLQECLDELRSDDSVELTESKERWSKKQKEKRRLKRQRQTAISGVQNRPSGMSQTGTPTESGSNAGQQTRVKAPHYTPEQERKAITFLQRLAALLGETMDNVDHTVYVHDQKNGKQLVFRLANHRGDARQFTERDETEGAFGVVIKMNEKRFKPDGGTDYQEEVFYPDKLSDEKMEAIAKGVSDWKQSGVYTGPKGDESNPQNPIHPNPVNRSVPWQPPTPPTTPPTGPGVLESLATKYFKEAHNMKYRLLKEAALEELIHEDWMGYSPEERRRLNRWQRSDIRDAEPYIPQAMIRGKTRRKSDSGEYTGPIIPAGQEFMERRRADALDPLFSQCLRYLRAMDKTSGEYQEMKDLMKQGRYREALRRFSQYDEFHFTPEYDEEERKRAKGEYGEYPDFGHADLNNPDVDAAFRDGQI